MADRAATGEDALERALLAEDAEDLYEDAPCGYLSALPDGTIARANRTFCSWTGYGAEELVGRRRFQELLSAGGRIYHETHVAPLLRMQGAVREIAVELVCADGRRLPVLINSMLRSDAAGEPLVVRTTVFVATDRKQYERELLRARQRTARLQAVTAELSRALTAGDAAAALVAAGTEAVGAADGWVGLVAEDGSELTVVAGRGSSDEPAALECVRDGEPRWLERAAMVPLVGVAGPLGCLVVEFDDPRGLAPDDESLLLTIGRQGGQAIERARLFEREQSTADELARRLTATLARREAEARQAADERRRLLEHLVSAQEEERRRIAVDVHDDYLQALSAVGMHLERAAGAAADADERERLTKLRAEVERTSDRMRGLVFSLRPPALDWSGLEAALRMQLESMREEWGLDYRVESHLGEEPSPERRLVTFRIAQEALTNVRKHARAKRVVVTLEEREGGVLTLIEDDGVGMPELREEVRRGHVGLASMRERAEAAGGWWRAASPPEGGTRVEFWVPGG